MKFCFAILLALGLSASLPTQASSAPYEIAGISIPTELTQQGIPLQLNGAGVRSKFFMDLYVGGLYLPNKADTAANALQQPVAAVSLHIISGLITADKMRAAISEGFNEATAGNTEAIQADITRFMGLFEEEIKEGDQFLLYASKETGVSAFKNGQLQDTITGEAFRQALLNIWLGDAPAQGSLKKAMLGR
ncbi:chalcone isomerase family protein [Shewanella sedimentimangrovi]|uniref:Chalcone isomerase family protein n=1 Tax=Shewanella sedimentimangrovi TaxID=2814293 RepID=A0ABX7QZT5_9GAMM|nr:chalcone isomerase family protein [Shewanella sedimentimangrovi]QSX36125.1 chalcone isomerase family protein [Shewanella sedimentimangrovi]